MKRFSVLVVLTLVTLACAGAQAQSLYGMFGLDSPDLGERQLGLVNTADGSIALIGTQQDADQITNPAGVTTINVADEEFYFIGEDTGDSTDKIFTADLNGVASPTGAALSAGYTRSTVFGIWHNKTSNILYGYAENPSTAGEKLIITIDPSTGTVTELLNLGTFDAAGGLITGDADGDRLFVVLDDGGDGWLQEVTDLTGTPATSGVPFPNSPSGLLGIEYNSQSGGMIALRLGGLVETFDFDEMEYLGSNQFEVNNGLGFSASTGQTAFDQRSGLLYVVGRDTDQGRFGVFEIDYSTPSSASESFTEFVATDIQINGWVGFDVQPGPDLSVSKSDDSGGNDYQPGDVVTYTISYSNAADAGRATGVALTETVPAGTTFSDADTSAAWSCNNGGVAGEDCTLSLADVAPGASASVDFAVQIASSVSASYTTIDNSVVLSAANAAMDSTDSMSSGLDATAVLAVSQSADIAPVQPGQTLTFTLTVSNTGDRDVDGITLTETVPLETSFNAGASNGGWSCSGGGGAGDSCTLALATLAGDSNQDVIFAVDVASTVAAASTEVTSDVSVASTTPVLSDSDLFAVALDASAELTLSKDDGTVGTTPGSVIAYTLDYGNSGDRNAGSVVLTETVPGQTSFNAANSSGGWVCDTGGAAGDSCNLAIGTLSGGDSGSAMFAVTVDSSVDSGTTGVANTASLTADSLPAVPASELTPLNASPVLSLSKGTGGISSVEPGGTPSFTLSYTNSGNEDAADTVVTETVPAQTQFVANESSLGWVCADVVSGSTCSYDIGTLAGGESGLIVFTVQLDDSVDAGTSSVTNTAELNASNATAVQSSDSVSVVAAPQLSVSVSDSPSSAAPGDVVIYSIAYDNTGNEDAANTALSASVPINTSFQVGSSTVGWACASTSAGGACTFALGSLAGSSPGIAQFAVTVDEPLAESVGDVSLSVQINADNAAPANAIDTTPVSRAPIAVDDDYTVNEDDALTVAAPGVLANDQDPDMTALQVGSVGPAPASGIGGEVILAADGSFSYTPPENAFGAASFSYDVIDGEGKQASATVTIEVSAVNDRPSFSLAPNPALMSGTSGPVTIAGFASSISTGPDENAQSISFLLTELSDPENVISAAAIDAVGTLSFEAGPGNGSASFSVVAIDDGGTANGGQDRSLTRSFSIALGGGVDLAIGKSNDRDALADGQLTIYTISVFNRGPADALGARVRDTLPPELVDAEWTCESTGAADCTPAGSGDIDDVVVIPANEGLVYRLEAFVDAGTSTSVSNTAIVEPASGTGDLDSSDNSATDTDSVDAIFSDRFELYD